MKPYPACCGFGLRTTIPNVGQIHRGVRPKLAREALIKLIGEDLGTDALAYWRLYLQRIEEENALRAAGG